MITLRHCNWNVPAGPGGAECTKKKKLGRGKTLQVKFLTETIEFKTHVLNLYKWPELF